jgi:hypothetical protein
MLQVFTWMIRLPTAVILTGVEAFRKALQEVQQFLDQGMPVVTTNTNDVGQSKTAECTTGTFQKEGEAMIDQDLGGDDLKYVSYSILFTKRDYEATLDQQQEFLINYATDGASFASLKMMEFSKKEYFERPQEWPAEGDGAYPPHAEGNHLTLDDIPKDDHKYLTFIYNVERRLSKQSKQYDKDQVRALEGIKREIRSQIGGSKT